MPDPNGIGYQNMNSGGAGNAHVFTDNFTRANSNDWGTNWIQQFSGSSDGSAYINHTIQGNAGRSTQVNAGAGDGNQIPVKLTWIPGAGGQLNQFIECTISATSVAGGGYDLLLCCPISWSNVGLKYYALVCSVGGTFKLQRWTNNPAATLQNPGVGAPTLSTFGGATWALGDTLRMEAVFSAATGFWTLTAKKNGVQAGSSFVDNVSGIAGMPIVHVDLANSGGTVDTTHISLGLL